MPSGNMFLFSWLSFNYLCMHFSLNDFVYNTFISCHEYKNVEVCVCVISVYIMNKPDALVIPMYCTSSTGTDLGGVNEPNILYGVTNSQISSFTFVLFKVSFLQLCYCIHPCKARLSTSIRTILEYMYMTCLACGRNQMKSMISHVQL